MNVKKEDWLFLCNIAKEGREWLRFKWEGEYGMKYSSETRERRIAEINEEISRIYQLKNKAK